MPYLQLCEHRARDEPAELHGKQDDARQLEKEIIDGQTDRDEDDEPHDPSHKREDDQESPQARREVLRIGLFPAQQLAAQKCARERA